MPRTKLEFKQCPDCPVGVLLSRSVFREVTRIIKGKKYTAIVNRCKKHEAQYSKNYQNTKVENGICTVFYSLGRR